MGTINYSSKQQFPSKENNRTLIDDDSLHSLFELVGGAETFNGAAQHPLLL